MTPLLLALRCRVVEVPFGIKNEAALRCEKKGLGRSGLKRGCGNASPLLGAGWSDAVAEWISKKGTSASARRICPACA
jgi:hypothetical protein